MPIEGARRFGFAEYDPPQTGFAQHAGKKTGSQKGGRTQSMTGFASLVRSQGGTISADGKISFEAQPASKEPEPRVRNKKDPSGAIIGTRTLEPAPTSRAKRYDAAPRRTRSGEAFDFPVAVVGRTIVRSTIDAPYRSFHRTLTARAASVGRVVGLDELTCVLLPHDQINKALQEKYDRIAHDETKAKQRAEKVREVKHFINDTVAQRKAEQQADLFVPLPHGLTRQSDDELWTPREFTFDYSHDATSATTLGSGIEDDNAILSQEAQIIAGAVAKEFDLNPHHFKALDEPVIDMVDTSPLGVSGLSVRLPSLPYAITLGTPAAR